MTTYAVLKSDVADWLLRDDLTNAIPSFIRLCEANIRRDVKVRAMETSASITITSGVATLPDGFIEARRLILDNSTYWALDYLPPDVLYSTQVYIESGSAVAYTIEGDSLIFRPSASESGLLLYSKAFDALADDSDTNWLLTNAYDIYLYGTLIHTAPYLKDDARLMVWGEMYAKAVAGINKQSSLSQFAGSALKTMVPA